MKFLILKDNDGTKIYINTKHITVIQEGSKDEKDCTTIIINGVDVPINVKGNVKTVVNTIRLVDHGVVNTDRDYDFELIKRI